MDQRRNRHRGGCLGFVGGITLALFVAPGPAVASVIGWVPQVVASGDRGSLTDPSLKMGYLSWIHSGGLGPASAQYEPGVYRRSADGTVLKLAGPSLGYQLGYPGSTGATSVDEHGNVSFLATQRSGTGVETEGLFQWRFGSLSTLALAGVTRLDGQSEALRDLGAPTRSLGLTVFGGTLAGAGAYLMVDDWSANPTVSMSLGRIMPTTLVNAPSTYPGSFSLLGAYPALDANERRTPWGIDLAFLGGTTFDRAAPNDDLYVSGIYIVDNMQTIEVAAERFMDLPGGLNGEQFLAFTNSPSLSNGQVAFTGYGDLGTQGVYISDINGQPQRLADTQMQAPDGLGRFQSFAGFVSNYNDTVAFLATTEFGGQSLFLAESGGITEVFGADDFAALFPGERYDGFQELDRVSVYGNQLAFNVSGSTSNWQYDHMVLLTGIVPVPGTLPLLALAMSLLLVVGRRSPRSCNNGEPG